MSQRGRNLVTMVMLSVALAGVWGAASAFAPDGGGCACTLRSWIVAGQGRHLVAEVDCEGEELDGAVEFTSTALRLDYAPTNDPARDDRIARMTPGVRLWPVVGDGRDREEERWVISEARAREILRDRVFSQRYYLLGPNSNSAMRQVLEGAGLALPVWMLDEGAPLGQFPGIHLSAGEELAPDAWPAYGVRAEADR